MNLAPSLETRLKRLEALAEQPLGIADAMRVARERLRAMDPATRQRERVDIALAALKEPDEASGTLARRVQDIRRRFALRHLFTRPTLPKGPQP